jgi:hypothetical protein
MDARYSPGTRKIGVSLIYLICSPIGDLALNGMAKERRASRELFNKVFERWSFVAKRDHGIDLCRSAGWKIASHDGDQDQRDDGPKKAGCVCTAKTEEHVCDDPASGECDGDSDDYAYGHQNHDLAHDQPANVGARGAYGDTDADLAGAPTDHVRHQAVDSDAGEKDGEEAEEGGELRDEPLVGYGAGYLCIERADTADG